MKYIKEKEVLKNSNYKSILNLISEDLTNKILDTYPTVPLDYLLFLNQIGAGNIKGSTFYLYSNLTDFKDLGLDDIYDLPPNIMLFGDNFSGDFSGFDLLKQDEVVEFWHDSEELFYTGKTFYEYIHDLIIV